MTISEMLKTETIPVYFTLKELEHLLDCLNGRTDWARELWTDLHNMILELVTDKINHEYEMVAARERETINEYTLREQELTAVFSTYRSSNYQSSYHVV